MAARCLLLLLLLLLLNLLLRVVACMLTICTTLSLLHLTCDGYCCCYTCCCYVKPVVESCCRYYNAEWFCLLDSWLLLLHLLVLPSDGCCYCYTYCCCGYTCCCCCFCCYTGSWVLLLQLLLSLLNSTHFKPLCRTGALDDHKALEEVLLDIGGALTKGGSTASYLTERNNCSWGEFILLTIMRGVYSFVDSIKPDIAFWQRLYGQQQTCITGSSTTLGPKSMTGCPNFCWDLMSGPLRRHAAHLTILPLSVSVKSTWSLLWKYWRLGTCYHVHLYWPKMLQRNSAGQMSWLTATPPWYLASMDQPSLCIRLKSYNNSWQTRPSHMLRCCMYILWCHCSRDHRTFPSSPSVMTVPTAHSHQPWSEPFGSGRLR